MEQYKYSSDNVNRRGFISKQSILALVSQEDIFKLVFKYAPKELEYVTSPLRQDEDPGCWFSYHINGTLYFIDFGNTRTHSDCFNVVQDFFGIPNFYLTLEYIYNHLIQGKALIAPVKIELKETKIVKQKVKILVEARPFSLLDKYFWEPYGIQKGELIGDKVFPFNRFYALNTKKGNITAQCQDIAYSYTEFEGGRKKLYFPKRKGRARFITNCGKNDIGGLHSLSQYSKQLIITKSYKDWRVLKNKGKNAIWFQNEGMFPDKGILFKILKQYSQIIILFDNDGPGILASEKLKNYIDTFYPNKTQILCVPRMHDVTDSSDLKAYDSVIFNQFIKDFT